MPIAAGWRFPGERSPATGAGPVCCEPGYRKCEAEVAGDAPLIVNCLRIYYDCTPGTGRF